MENPVPKDVQLYKKTKAIVYEKNPKHSAYRSGIIVQKYKNEFFKKYGSESPYIGKKHLNMD